MNKNLETKMNELAEEFYHRTGYAATEWAVINFMAGGQAMHDLMIEDMKKLVEALEDASKYHNTDDVNGEAGYICWKALQEFKSKWGEK